MVASATSTNGVVQGLAQEEKLIVAVKAVASSTVQLLVTCQVKADAHSENNRYNTHTISNAWGPSLIRIAWDLFFW